MTPIKPQPDKASTTFLTWASPMLDLVMEPIEPPTAAELKQALDLAVTIWNAITVDMWQESDESTAELVASRWPRSPRRSC